jgi:hypothetical protein
VHPNRRRRLAGLLVAALAPVVATALAVPAAHALSPDDPNLAPCTSAGGNLVVNCGFEAPVSSAGLVPGWTHLVARASNVASPANAHSGTHVLQFSSTTGDDVWTQTVPVRPHTRYLVGAQFNASEGLASSPSDRIRLTATNIGEAGKGSTIYDSTDDVTTWARGAEVVTTGSDRTMTLTLAGQNVPSATYVDDVFVLPQHSGCEQLVNNLVRNCGFEAASIAPWVHVVNDDSFLGSPANSGNNALEFGSSTSTNDVWTQTLSVHPRTAYRLSYWVAYYSGPSGTPNNNLTVSVSNVPSLPGGKRSVTTTNVANRFWAQVTTTFVTGSSSTAVLTLSGANAPAHTYVDDFSVTVVPHLKVTAAKRKVTTTLTGLGGQTVTLQHYAHHRWSGVKAFVAPKSGFAKAWTVKVGSAGKYRAVSAATPGYSAATSAAITVH